MHPNPCRSAVPLHFGFGTQLNKGIFYPLSLDPMADQGIEDQTAASEWQQENVQAPLLKRYSQRLENINDITLGKSQDDSKHHSSLIQHFEFSDSKQIDAWL